MINTMPRAQLGALRHLTGKIADRYDGSTFVIEKSAELASVLLFAQTKHHMIGIIVGPRGGATQTSGPKIVASARYS